MELHEEAMNRVLRGISEQIRINVHETVRDTVDLDVERAAEVLQERVNRIDGVTVDRQWCRHALTPLRCGDDRLTQVAVGG